MRRLVAVAAAATLLLALTPQPASVAAGEGVMFKGQEARVWYHKTTSPGWGYDQALYLQFSVGMLKPLAQGDKWEPIATVCGTYERSLSWQGQQLEYYVWSGCSPLTGFVFDGLSSASVAPIDGTMFVLSLPPANDAAVYYGPVWIGGYTWQGEPLHWTGNNDPTTRIIQKDRLIPSPQAQPGPGGHVIERYVTATVSGVVWNSSFPGLWGPADCVLAEIGELKNKMIDSPAT